LEVMSEKVISIVTPPVGDESPKPRERRRKEEEKKEEKKEGEVSDKDFWRSIKSEILIDPNKSVPRPEPIFAIKSAVSLQDQPVLTPGNFAVVAAQAKTAKTRFVGAAVSAIIASSSKDFAGDTLGWVAKSNTEGRAVIYIDTEQAEFHAQQNLRQIMKRVGCDHLPQWVMPLKLLGQPLTSRLRILDVAVKEAKEEHGGIYCVIIDGGADFLPSTSDEVESARFVDELHAIALRYNTGILTVIHENPGENLNAKTRGHFGSHLERKSESNLRLEKVGDVICVHAQRGMRGGHLPKEEGPQLQWSGIEGMHVSVPREGRAPIKGEGKGGKPGAPPKTEYSKDAAERIFREAAKKGVEKPKSKEGAKRILKGKKWSERSTRDLVQEMSLEAIQNLFP
jgi:hypothetical protein